MFSAGIAASGGAACALLIRSAVVEMAAAATSHSVRHLAKSAAKRLADTVPQSLVADIQQLSKKKQKGVSLKYMMDFGLNPVNRQYLLSAQFLHEELPTRLAHRVMELEALPFGLSSKSQVLKVRDWYVESFKELREMAPIQTLEDEKQFTQLLGRIKQRHDYVVPMVALGVASLKEDIKRGTAWYELPDIHSFLDRFYMSRIGIRMLIGQHLSLHEPPSEDKERIGLIDAKLSPYEVAHDAVEDARQICMRQFGSAPEIKLFGSPDLTFPYVPEHLHHMLFELIKNSLRAVAEKYEDDFTVDAPPPVRIVIAEGNEDITIKVSDEGGGIPRSGMPRIWTYLYSTASSPLQHLSEEDVAETPAVLAGYGYGLPLCRLYARYFGGDLQVMSMDGYGTDAYLHLSKLGTSEEPLP